MLKSLKKWVVILLEKWMTRNNCNICGQFTPGKMMENGVCLICVVEQEKNDQTMEEKKQFYKAAKMIRTLADSWFRKQKDE